MYVPFATPLLWVPEKDYKTLLSEIPLMLERSEAANNLLNGSLSCSDYLELIDSHSIDVDQTLKDWEQGISYI